MKSSRHVPSALWLGAALGLAVCGCDPSGSATSTAGAEAGGRSGPATAARGQAARRGPSLPGVLVSADWLAAHLTAPLVVVDARTSEEYAAGHIPGAVSFPYEETYGDDDSRNLAPVAKLDERFGRAGLDLRTTVVVYGPPEDYRPAARLFWVLEVCGHPAVSVLNGGLPAWKRAGGSLSTAPERRPPARFVAEFDPARLADKLEVRRALRDDSTVLLDSRSAQDYRGDRRNERFARHGHIPTAINRPCTEDYVQDGAVCTVREPGVLEQAYADLRGKKVYTYCSTGRSASVSYLALRAIGADVAVYDGAWLEWSSDERLPVWAGPEPGAAP